MVKVMAFGTFDLLHKGHIHFLKRASSFGDLVVVVARDKTVKDVKGSFPIESEVERFNNVKKLGFVSKAILGNLGDKYKVIDDEKPDIICLGYDQVAFTQNLEEKIKKLGLSAKIIRLEPYKPDIYKSSFLKSASYRKT